MATLPLAGTFDVPAVPTDFTNEDFATAQGQFLEFVRQMVGSAAETALTIASGSIVPNQGCHTVDTQGAASSDDLTRINYENLPDGSMLLLWPASAARVVTVKHTFASAYTGRISLQDETDHVMDSAEKCILLQRRGNTWYEVSRVGIVTAQHGSVLITSSQSWTVPAGVTTIYVTLIGGGGGGGGGGGRNLDGSAAHGTTGTAGGNSAFQPHLSCAGGQGGERGFSTGLGGRAQSKGQQGGRDFNASSSAAGSGGFCGFTPLGVYGSGGNGGTGGAIYDNIAGGGGASGGITASIYYKEPISVVPGAVKTVTIGAGGAGGAGGVGTYSSGTNGTAGASGACLIEW